MNEFTSEFPSKAPIARRGLTSIEALVFIRADQPEVIDWTCWRPRRSGLFSRLVACDGLPNGEIEGWRWNFIESSYPAVRYHEGYRIRTTGERNWTGMLRITSPAGESFILFSFLDSEGSVGNRYYVSTRKPALLEAFEEAVRLYFDETPDDRICINVVNGRDIRMEREMEGEVFMPQTMRDDIDRQVTTFYSQPDNYRRLRLPYRRGLLFAGEPGCGKTMMVRRLVRMCAVRFKASFWSIKVGRGTEADELEGLFDVASKNTPSMIILEEIDSLIRESSVPRSTLLACLDGLEPRNGILIIGTTNNPGEVDPALMHRPSRFDRVWTFEPPSLVLRQGYLEGLFPGHRDGFCDELAMITEGWSYAYLNEIRVTASFMAVGDGLREPDEARILQAHDLLACQFKSGRKNHVGATPKGPVGFGCVTLQSN